VSRLDRVVWTSNKPAIGGSAGQSQVDRGRGEKAVVLSANKECVSRVTMQESQLG
jgi:hypothetical protein